MGDEAISLPVSIPVYLVVSPPLSVPMYASLVLCLMFSDRPLFSPLCLFLSLSLSVFLSYLPPFDL